MKQTTSEHTISKLVGKKDNKKMIKWEKKHLLFRKTNKLHTLLETMEFWSIEYYL